MIELKYSDVAVGAKEGSSLSSTSAYEETNLTNLKNDVTLPNYANPCELNQMFLDGTQESITEEPTIAYWSNETSDENGDFTENPTITANLDDYYKSVGISLTFQQSPCDFTVDWYTDEEIVSTMSYVATTLTPFVSNTVENFDKIVITLTKTSMPYTRAKLNDIQYGVVRYIYDDELKNITVSEEINEISEEITINTLGFTLISKSDVDYIFQSKQPFELRFNDELISKTFIEKATRTSKNSYNISNIDYIGMLEKIPYMGGIFTDKNAYTLATEIFDTANTPFVMSDDLKTKTINGYIPITNCRIAVQLLAFAINAIVDTSRSDSVNIFTASTEQIESTGEIMLGQSFAGDDDATEIQLTVHEYITNTESTTLYTGTADNLTVTFSEPMHTLAFDGTISEYGANYAIITGTGTLTGQKYDNHEILYSVKNPYVLSTDKENIVTFDCPLQCDAQSTTQHIYDLLSNDQYTSMKMVLRDDEKCGSYISFDADYLGQKSGRIISMKYVLSGKRISADLVVNDL